MHLHIFYFIFRHISSTLHGQNNISAILKYQGYNQSVKIGRNSFAEICQNQELSKKMLKLKMIEIKNIVAI